MKRFLLGGAAMLMAISLPLASLAELSVSVDFMLDGEAFSLPLAVSDLTERGWSISQPEEILTPGSFSVSDRMSRGGETLQVQVINLTETDLEKTDGLIGQITVSGDFCGSFSTNGWSLPEAAQPVDEAATPTDLSADVRENVVRTGREYDKLEVSFLPDGSVDKLTLRSFTPKAPVQSKSRAAVSTPAQAESFAYTAPDELGGELSRCRFRLNDTLYQLPVPWSVCAENGWVLSANDQATLAASTLSDLMAVRTADGLELYVMLYNTDTSASALSDCLVVGMSISRGSNVNVQLPDQISFTTDETEMIGILGDSPYAVYEDAHETLLSLDLGKSTSMTWHFDRLTRRMNSMELYRMP